MRPSDVGRKRDNPSDPRRNVTEAARARKRRWQRAHYSVEKNRAYRVLRTAIESGAVVKPNSCGKCGTAAKRQDGASAIQGHHDDYSKPLSVKWLCPPCHRSHHDAALADPKAGEG